ncbi:ABC transporter permease [Pseudooceanicola sp. 502str34]
MIGVALGSLWNRRFVAALTMASIALSVALILGVERLRTEARDSFANSASGIDLIVAARGNPVQILMATVFGVGSAGPGISRDTYEMVAARPEVAWAVPMQMGDNHRGFPVIGTTDAYFTRLRHSGGQPLVFAQGVPFEEGDAAGAVVGAEVAARFGYAPGTVIVNAHGAGAVAFDVHEDAPFTITGVLERTGTAVDRIVLVSLAGFDALHAARGPVAADPFDDPLAGSGLAAPGAGEPAIPEALAVEDDAAPEGHGGHPVDHDPEAEAAQDADHAHDVDHAHEADHSAAEDHEHDPDHDMATDHAHDVDPAAGGAEGQADHGDHDHDDPEHDDHDGHDHDDHGHGAEDVPDAHAGHEHTPDLLNAVYVGLADRGAVLGLQRAFSEYRGEAISAVLPNVALLELWSITGTAETALQLMAWAVALAGITGMVVMLSATLEARRREFAILRSVGATPARVFALILIEAAVLTLGGLALGSLLLTLATLLADPILSARFGMRIGAGLAGRGELAMMGAILLAGLAAALLPALRVYRMTLADGLSPRM